MHIYVCIYKYICKYVCVNIYKLYLLLFENVAMNKFIIVHILFHIKICKRFG